MPPSTRIRAATSALRARRDGDCGRDQRHRQRHRHSRRRRCRQFSPCSRRSSPRRTAPKAGSASASRSRKGLVQLHGGTIEARSAGRGRGSEFIVRMPRARPCRRRRERVAPRRRAAAASAPRADRRRQPGCGRSLAMLLRAGRPRGDGRARRPRRRSRRSTRCSPRSCCSTSACRNSTATRSRDACAQATPRPRVMLIAITGWGQDSDKERAHRRRVRSSLHQADRTGPAAFAPSLAAIGQLRPPAR